MGTQRLGLSLLATFLTDLLTGQQLRHACIQCAEIRSKKRAGRSRWNRLAVSN